MVKRSSWRDTEDREAVVEGAARALLAGELVVFPSDTVYVIAGHAARPDAVKRVAEIAGESAKRRPRLSVTGADAALRWVGPFGRVARRLATRCWPGPVALAVDPPGDATAWSEQPEITRTAVSSERGVGVDCPDHGAILEVMRRLEAPLVTAIAGPEESFDADAASAVADEAVVLIDDGPTRYRKSASFVDATSRGLSMIHEGVASERRIRRLAGEIITFVCTGNTCRSPMAEVILKKLVADELGCDVEELPDKGITILSAGLAALNGEPASENSQIVVAELGANLEQHASQSLTRDIAFLSDRLITMTREHRRLIITAWPMLAEKTTPLAGDRDITDPVGDTLDRYRDCASRIESELRKMLPEIVRARTGS